MRKFFPVFLALLLTGCASTFEKTDTIEVLFVYGTMKAIEKADDPQAKAARIQKIAQDVDDLAATGNIRAELVQRLIDTAIEDSDLTPSDLYLVGQVTPLSAEFAGEDGFITGTKLEALRRFLADVIAATELYANP